MLPVPLSRTLAAYTGFRRTQPNIGTEILIPVTNPIERLNSEIKRRTEVVGIFPNEAATTPLVGALVLEQNDEWAVHRARYMSLETIAQTSDDATVRLTNMTDSPNTGRSRRTRRAKAQLHHTT